MAKEGRKEGRGIRRKRWRCVRREGTEGRREGRKEGEEEKKYGVEGGREGGKDEVTLKMKIGRKG